MARGKKNLGFPKTSESIAKRKKLFPKFLFPIKSWKFLKISQKSVSEPLEYFDEYVTDVGTSQSSVTPATLVVICKSKYR